MQGLVTTERNNIDPAAAPFAKNPRDIDGLTEGASIIEVVNVTRFIEKNSIWAKAIFSYNIEMNHFDIKLLNPNFVTLILNVYAFLC
jgi:hypothetical protein